MKQIIGAVAFLSLLMTTVAFAATGGGDVVIK